MGANGSPATLEEIKALPKEMLTPKDVHVYLGCKQYSINIQARQDPKKLGFPVCVIGTRVRIPKNPFIIWADGQDENSEYSLS